MQKTIASHLAVVTAAAFLLAPMQAQAEQAATDTNAHTHDHAHSHDHDDRDIYKGYFDDDQIKDRALSDH